ncbi:hypothetical protein PIB30_014821 [Stylosanthes scabra]|uniref:GAG-pre-integrase domain-containing protein n=1 Tax=Stylosanthes scabra TaxID=79078 RepID=A0ABU6Q6U9_9FABA|nr:hypothetical protein [Stylosanthes scabra]
MPPPPGTSFHQPKSYYTTSSTISEASWFANSGATHHVTAEHSNILQHSESNQAPEQLLGTKAILFKGRTKGGLYCFDDLLANLATTRTQNVFELWHKRLGHSHIKIVSHDISRTIPVHETGSTSGERSATQPLTVDTTPTSASIPNPSPSNPEAIPISGIEVVSTISQPVKSSTNTHQMQTRSKTGNLKPISFISAAHFDPDLLYHTPRTIVHALNSKIGNKLWIMNIMP